MSASSIDRLVDAAVAAGLLPAGSTAPTGETRPWPVLLLTAFGAWLAALPLTGVLIPVLDGGNGIEPYVIGAIVLGGAVRTLRLHSLPLFIEQLAMPALLVGAGALGIGLFRDLPPQAAAAVLAAVTLAAALLVPAAWLRALLGAALAPLLALALMSEPWTVFERRAAWPYWLAWHLVFAASLAAGWAQHRSGETGATARRAAVLDPLLAGVQLAAFVALAWWSGGTLGGVPFGDETRAASVLFNPAAATAGIQAVSAVLAIIAAGWLARAWPSLRRPWCAVVGAVLAVLAWCLPALGAVLLALSVCAAGQRWRMAGAAAFAAAWMVGGFYHRLDAPLAEKALVLVGAGLVMAALAWWASPRTPRRAAASSPSRGTAAGIVLTMLAVLAVVNVGIRQKEQIIANGQPVLVELAPVDPRSLMQGDYMRLDYRLPEDLRRQLAHSPVGPHPHVVAQRDARGVATLRRLDDGSALGPGELRIELTPKDGRWVLVSDAWFFREGEAARWASAKYGEFRVDAQGRALLVGLRDAALRKL